MSTQRTGGGFSALVASLTIVIALIIGFSIYQFVFGDPANFSGLEKGKVAEASHPLNTFGTIYKGGIIVPFLVAVNLVVIIFSVERAFGLFSARGKKNLNGFISNVQESLDNNDIAGAIELCDSQKGSIANVIRSGLEKYEFVQNDASLDREAKIDAIKKEIEDTVALEMPMMSKNLVIISTCASIGTLIGLIGTVVGMIKSFQAMGAGTPDTSKLSVGISEALINTFFGIFASTLAIIVYNYFTTKIDQLTHAMDEAGYAIVQNFTARNK